MYTYIHQYLLRNSQEPCFFLCFFFNIRNDFVSNISIRGQNLLLISQTKFLGILIDEQLRFSNNINQMCKKVSFSVGLIKNSSAYLPQSSLRTLYNSIVYPYIVYAIEVFGSSSETQLNRLRKL